MFVFAFALSHLTWETWVARAIPATLAFQDLLQQFPDQYLMKHLWASSTEAEDDPGADPPVQLAKLLRRRNTQVKQHYG